jgi:hypothetical protein
MAAKFKLTLGRLPDFKLPVKFIMPNGEEAKIVFTVKHKTGGEIEELYQTGAKDAEFITNIACGWDLEEEFNSENADMLVKLYPAAAIALASAYVGALAGQRVKN